jgi:hypothetical protein
VIQSKVYKNYQTSKDMTAITKTSAKQAMKQAAKNTIKNEAFKIVTEPITKDWKAYDFNVDYLMGEGSAFDAPVEIHSINGQPAELYCEDLLELIEEEIRFHEFKGTNSKIEYKSEQRGDEERGN